jgi:1,2-diacylglycerol 3-beta-galactosyltransferase
MGAAESAPRKLRGADSERVPLAPSADDLDLGARPPSPRAVSRFSSASGREAPLHHRDLASEPRTPPTRVSGESPRGRVVSAPATPTGGGGGRPMRLLVLMSDTGGGHRASADALETAFGQLQGAGNGGAAITIVDFWVCVAGFPFHNFPSQYTYLAKRPMLWYAVYLWAKFPPTRWLTETAFSVFCFRKVRRYFEAHNADVIISVHPLVNTLSLSVLDSMRRAMQRPTPPYVTVVTDLGGAHPTWFDARSDAVYVPSDPLRDTAEAVGVSPDRIRMFGLPIRSSFWTEARSRDELRRELGMALEMPAVLLVGGGDGVGGLRAIAAAIAARIASSVGDSAGQLVVVCGKNKALLAELQSQSWPIPVILKGFVRNMSEWMSACDILCSKAGPGTIAEGWTRGLPIVITGFLPGQEEGNVQLVTESGSGEYHDTPEGIADCCARIVADPELRGAMASRARELGRPNSTRQIAADVWDLTVTRARERDRIALGRRLASAPVPAVPNGYAAMTRYYLVNGMRYIQRSLPSMFGQAHDPMRLRPA